MDSLSPFDQFRARSLLTWPLLVFLFVGLLTEHLIRLTGAHRVGNIIIILEFEATCVIWALQQCRRHRISILRIFGPVPRNPRTWTYIALAPALGVLSGGTVWLRVPLRYFLLVRFGHTCFADWLIYRPQFVTNFDVWNIPSLVQDVTL